MTGVSTITLIIHGVGDHQSGDILKNVEQAYRIYVSAATMVLESPQEVDLSQFLPADHHENLTVSALRIRLPSGVHVVGAINWSHTRKRLAQRDQNMTKATPIRRTASAIKSLWAIVADLIYLLRPRNWQLSQPWVRLCAVVLLCGCLGYGLCLGGAAAVSGATLGIPFLKAAREGLVDILPRCIRDNRTALVAFFASFAVSILLPFIVLKFLVAWDLIEDVLAYIANGPRRKMLIESISQTISNIDDARAGVPLILVGHSLGSVLLTHSIPWLRGGASVLVTCGSPLELMAKAFPKVVLSGSAIASEILNPSGLRKWINLYRDADYVGRSLRVARFENFSEKSIGDGGHANYYSDRRFWRAVLDAVVTQSTPLPIAVAELPQIREQELRELSDLRHLIQLSPWIGLLAGVLVVFLARYYVLVEGSLSLLCLSAPFVWFFIAATAAFLASQFSMLSVLAFRRKQLRQLPLSELRLWRGPLWLATLCGAVFPLFALLCLQIA